MSLEILLPTCSSVATKYYYRVIILYIILTTMCSVVYILVWFQYNITGGFPAISSDMELQCCVSISRESRRTLSSSIGNSYLPDSVFPFWSFIFLHLRRSSIRISAGITNGPPSKPRPPEFGTPSLGSYLLNGLQFGFQKASYIRYGPIQPQMTGRRRKARIPSPLIYEPGIMTPLSY